MYSMKLYKGITMSKSSALSISVLLVSKMQLVKGALFLSANFLSYTSLSGFVTIIFPLTTIYDHTDLILTLMF